MGLVITRKDKESVFIGEDICFTVHLNGNQVRLDIEAPRDLTVVREELLDPDELKIDSSISLE